MFGIFITGFVLGNMLGILVCVIVSGSMDNYTEWRKKKNEQKGKSLPQYRDIRDRDLYRDGAGHRGIPGSRRKE